MSSRVELFAQQAEHGDELAEDQHAVAAVDDLFQQFAEQVELAGGVRRA